MNARVPISRERFGICNLPVVSHVSEGAHAFVGHAYGSPNKNSETDFLALNVLNFIQQNKHILKSITFTGDVFAVPSLKNGRG